MVEGFHSDLLPGGDRGILESGGQLPSFYSEKTAEYALVPKFVELLEPLGAVAPIAFAGQSVVVY